MISARARFAIALVAMLSAAHARADDTVPSDDVMVRIRELYERGDYEGVRRELLAAYERTPHPSLLFAIGQAEFNLRHWQAAIDYYEKFVATNPPSEQISLAQQGIGAARIEMQRERDKPAPPKPSEPRHRTWFRSDTVIVGAAGGAVAIGAGLFGYGQHLGNDRSESLAAYDARADRARTYQWIGAGLAAAGVITAGIAVLRWRLRPDDGEVVVTPTANGAAISGTW